MRSGHALLTLTRTFILLLSIRIIVSFRVKLNRRQSGEYGGSWMLLSLLLLLLLLVLLLLADAIVFRLTKAGDAVVVVAGDKSSSGASREEAKGERLGKVHRVERERKRVAYVCSLWRRQAASASTVLYSQTRQMGKLLRKSGSWQVFFPTCPRFPLTPDDSSPTLCSRKCSSHWSQTLVWFSHLGRFDCNLLNAFSRGPQNSPLLSRDARGEREEKRMENMTKREARFWNSPPKQQWGDFLGKKNWNKNLASFALPRGKAWFSSSSPFPWEIFFKVPDHAVHRLAKLEGGGRGKAKSDFRESTQEKAIFFISHPNCVCVLILPDVRIWRNKSGQNMKWSARLKSNYECPPFKRTTIPLFLPSN